MGRKLNSDTTQVIVPINGSIFKNGGNGLLTDANGAQYIPSSGIIIMASTDYPKYVALNTLTSSSSTRPIGTSANGYFNNGTLTASSVTISAGGQYNPYTSSTAQQNYPFSGQSSKVWFTGTTATSGSIAVLAFSRIGYKNSGSDNIPAYVFNTSGTLLNIPTTRAAYCWYDSTSATFRIVGANSGSTATLYTSSNGTTWTSATISQTSVGGNSWGWGNLGSSSYYNMAAVGSGQKVFITVLASTTGNSYALFASTNNGVSFTDVTRALNGSTNDFYNSSGAQTYVNLNYDGTTLFMPISGSWRFSTNDGTSFSNSTITGVTTSIDNNAMGAIRGGNSSTFMYLFNSSATSNRVYVTTDGGQSFVSYSWTPAATLNSSYALMPGGYDGSTRWCFAYQTTAGKYVATSTDNGATWTHTQVTTTTTYSEPFICAYLDDAFYLATNSDGIYRSTNGTTWTRLTTSVQFPGYGQPCYTLTSAVVIGNWVIRKSDQAVFDLNPGYLLQNNSGLTKNFGNYISSDMFVQAQPGALNSAYQLITSATAFTGNIYNPFSYSNQQQASSNNANPTTIEYWRIR
jgi:hypothetical protein